MYLLGIDIGTSSSKAILIDGDGKTVAHASAPHAISRPRIGWSEQDPEWWWQAILSVVKSIHSQIGHSNPIDAVGLSGQMHGSVFLGEGSTPDVPEVLHPALLWNDQRTQHQCKSIANRMGGTNVVLDRTGNPPLTGFTAPKVLWLAENHPSLFDQLKTVMLPKDYIAYRMTGQETTDVGDASGTLLFNLKDRKWDSTLCESIGLRIDQLPRCIESTEIAGALSPPVADLTGLPASLPIVVGSGDQMTGAVGMGIVRPGSLSITLGTSGVVFAHVGSEVPKDERGRLQRMCSAIPLEYCVYGCMLTAADSISWFRSQFAPEMTFNEIDDLAMTVAPGSDGLIFLPYLNGERCPFADATATASFVGLTMKHTKAHLARAVLEGVAFNLEIITSLISNSNDETSPITVSGGGAESQAWLEILATILQRPVVQTTNQEGSAFGAALLAGVGIGHWSDVQSASQNTICVQQPIEPRSDWVTAYDEAKQAFKQSLNRLEYER